MQLDIRYFWKPLWYSTSRELHVHWEIGAVPDDARQIIANASTLFVCYIYSHTSLMRSSVLPTFAGNS